MRRREKTVHNLFVGIGTGVRNEIIHFFGRGRQTDKVEVNAANQNGLVRLRRGLHTFLFEFGEDEVVDGIADPGRYLLPQEAAAAPALHRPNV